MEITDAEIKTDIEGFKNRIRKAEIKLAELPRERLPYKQYRQREDLKQSLESEIEHCRQLIGYAQEALNFGKGKTL